MIQKNTFYHIYNQGNRRQQIFFEEGDYIKFLQLVKKIILPNCEVLAYCLMPNHFHFLVNTTDDSATEIKQGNIVTTKLSNGFRMLQSSYAQYINKKQNQFGSLFKQKAQFKAIYNTDKNDFLLNCFIYIHQNPLKAELVKHLKNWKFSSYLDFAGLRNDNLVNHEAGNKYLDISSFDFISLMQMNIDEKIIVNFY